MQVLGTHNYVTIDGAVHHNSGKSVACVAKMWCISMEMPPDSDGIRRSKWLIIRNTFAELKSTTIKTFQEVFPPENVGDISTSSSPIEFVIDQPATGGVPGWRIEFVFMALDRPADVKKLKSFECTGAWVNEAIEIPAEIIQMLTGRVGRYTAGSMFGGREDMAGRWMGIIADTNACDETNWWYRASEQDQRPEVHPEVAAMLGMDLEWRFFKQPPAVLECENGKDGWVVKEPGREPVVVERKKVFQAAARHWTVNPEAENLQNLNRFAPSYYPQQLSLPTVTLSHIQRMIQAKYIIAVPGKPWVPEYDDASMARDLLFDKNLPLVGGMDVGGGTLRPAAVFGQRGMLGDWRILSEVVCFDMGVDEMVTLMKLHLAERYPGVILSRLWLDPAAVQRDQLYKTAIIEHLRANGFRMADTAPTNDPDMRRQALALPMTRLTRTPGGPVPAFMVDRGCKQLRQALAGKWHRRQINVRGDAKYAERPEKNEWSDVGDAASYLCLGGGEHRAFTTGRMQPQGFVPHAGPRPNLMNSVRPFG